MKKVILPFAGAFILSISFLFFAFSKADNPFFNKVSQANVAEIQEGKLAVSRGSITIKRLGQQMISDYTIEEEELIKIAKKENLIIIMHTDITHKHILDSLSSLSGKMFDAAYMKCQVVDHKIAIALFREESISGIDSDIKEFAGKYLLLLEMHLNMFNGDSSAMKITIDSPVNK